MSDNKIGLMTVLGYGSDIDVIDRTCRYKFDWTWLDKPASEFDSHSGSNSFSYQSDCLIGDFIRKVDLAGIATCVWCGEIVVYGYRGQCAIFEHMKTKRHCSNARKKISNLKFHQLQVQTDSVISSQEAKCLAGFDGRVGDMSVPSEVVGDGDTQMRTRPGASMELGEATVGLGKKTRLDKEFWNTHIFYTDLSSENKKQLKQDSSAQSKSKEGTANEENDDVIIVDSEEHRDAPQQPEVGLEVTVTRDPHLSCFLQQYLSPDWPAP